MVAVIVISHYSRRVDVKWLTAFVTVAEELSFRRAAGRLFIAQPAVSQQIRNLERELGVRLFERTKRTVRLSEAGSAFLEPCRAVLAGIDHATRLARNAGSGEYGSIRLGFNAGFTTDYLVTLARVLAAEHPGLQVTFDVSRGTPDILRLVRDDHLDLGLVGGPVTGVGLGHRRIGSTSLGVVLPETHPLATESALPVSRLLGEPLVLVEAQPGWSIRAMVQDVFSGLGAAPAKITTVADGMTMQAFVLAGIGIGFAPMNTAARMPRSLVLRPLEGAQATPTSAVWKQANETPALLTVVAAIDRHVVDHRGR